jgi:ketosteroid isomerase-like protein
MRIEERFECWNRGELDLMIEPYAEDAVFDVSNVFRDIPPVQGHEAMRESWYRLRETWGELRCDPIELLDVGNNRFVLEVRLWGKGRSSGAEVDQRFAMLYTFSDDKITRAELHREVSAAISAAESASIA